MIGFASSFVRPAAAALLVGLAACSGGEPDASDSGPRTPGAEGASATEEPGMPGSGAATGESTPVPADARVGDLGETLEFGAGHRATVHGVEMDVRGEYVMMGQPDTVEMIVIDAELCAGSEALDLRLTSAANFGLYRPSQTLRGTGGRNQTFNGEPTFSRPSMAEPLGSGECIRGPVLVPGESEDRFAAAVFDSEMHSGAPTDQQVKLAWRLQ